MTPLQFLKEIIDYTTYRPFNSAKDFWFYLFLRLAIVLMSCALIMTVSCLITIPTFILTITETTMGVVVFPYFMSLFMMIISTSMNR